MKKLILSSLLISSSLLGDVKAPEVLTKNSFETAEYQLFISNTKNIAVTKDMTPKLIFEGKIKDYYTEYNKMVEKRFNTAEEVSKRLAILNQSVGNAVYFKDIQSLQNIGIATVGSIALNAMLGSVLGDDTYVQVVDYYQDDKPITRVLKYLVSDDGLDENEIKLVFNTTNDQSYHFRSGGFQTVTFK
jgi:N-acetylglutamate synthase-like GNAT family acetyltransferase